jgi:hypothetical protein
LYRNPAKQTLRPRRIPRSWSASSFRLYTGLGETFAGLSRPAEAIEFYAKAAAENPNDIAPRVALFQLAVVTNNPSLQAKMLTEIETLDGPGSPVRVVCEITRAQGLETGVRRCTAH